MKKHWPFVQRTAALIGCLLCIAGAVQAAEETIAISGTLDYYTDLDTGQQTTGGTFTATVTHDAQAPISNQTSINTLWQPSVSSISYEVRDASGSLLLQRAIQTDAAAAATYQHTFAEDTGWHVLYYLIENDYLDAAGGWAGFEYAQAFFVDTTGQMLASLNDYPSAPEGTFDPARSKFKGYSDNAAIGRFDWRGSIASAQIVGDTTAPVVTIQSPSSGQVEAVNTGISFQASIQEDTELSSAEWTITDFDGQETLVASAISAPSGNV